MQSVSSFINQWNVSWKKGMVDASDNTPGSFTTWPVNSLKSWMNNSKRWSGAGESAFPADRNGVSASPHLSPRKIDSGLDTIPQRSGYEARPLSTGARPLELTDTTTDYCPHQYQCGPKCGENHWKSSSMEENTQPSFPEGLLLKLAGHNMVVTRYQARKKGGVKSSRALFLPQNDEKLWSRKNGHIGTPL